METLRLICLLVPLASGLNFANTDGEDPRLRDAIQKRASSAPGICSPSSEGCVQPVENSISPKSQAQAEAWAKALPLVPLHIPKTGGTAFSLKLLADKRVCNFASAQEAAEFIRSIDDYVPEGHGTFLVGETDVSSVAFLRNSLRQFCPGVDIGAAQAALHIGIGSQFDRVRGRLMTMVRNPQERLVSNYWYTKGLGKFAQEMSLRDFAQRSSGCFVRMLTRDDPNACLDLNVTPPTPAEFQLAQSRLLAGFSFVGLQEQWDLSMCLFQKKFGGQCTEVDFLQLRPTQKQGHAAGERWNVSELDGFTDQWDTALYFSAKGMFEEDLRRHNVNPESCAACFAHKTAPLNLA